MLFSHNFTMQFPFEEKGYGHKPLFLPSGSLHKNTLFIMALIGSLVSVQQSSQIHPSSHCQPALAQKQI